MAGATVPPVRASYGKCRRFLSLGRHLERAEEREIASHGSRGGCATARNKPAHALVFPVHGILTRSPFPSRSTMEGQTEPGSAGSGGPLSCEFTLKALNGGQMKV